MASSSVSGGTPWARTIVKKTLQLEKASGKPISILLTDDKTIRQINKKYLNHDYVTDVISFDTGDIVVSKPFAKRYAKKLKISAKEELARYLVHGTLHLLGYDDHKPKDRDKMFARQEAILKKVLS